ncbi:MAG TPA: hypothetical protein VKH34_12545 [Vicinamibacterales bacterium]|jgi:hypothetical protein|nr:hypothetical protein [Vicinamibacterales bacterium]
MIPEDDQSAVARVLASVPPPEVSADFVARVNARIDDAAGWFGLADFRAWTLRLAPAAVVLALLAVLWPGSAATGTSVSPAGTEIVSTDAGFSPASATDWQEEVSADALLAAALRAPTEGARVR